MNYEEAWRQLRGFIDGQVTACASDAEAVQSYMTDLEKEIEPVPPRVQDVPRVRTGVNG